MLCSYSMCIWKAFIPVAVCHRLYISEFSNQQSDFTCKSNHKKLTVMHIHLVSISIIIWTGFWHFNRDIFMVDSFAWLENSNRICVWFFFVVYVCLASSEVGRCVKKYGFQLNQSVYGSTLSTNLFFKKENICREIEIALERKLFFEIIDSFLCSARYGEFAVLWRDWGTMVETTSHFIWPKFFTGVFL